jgi:anti-sigma factor RsiW
MTCDESRTYLPAYLDGELDIAETLRVREHLAG